MDLLDPIDSSQDVKDGECSLTSSETADIVAAETCLVVEGSREVLAMVEDDDDGGRIVSDDDDDDVNSSTALHRTPHVVIQSSAGRQRRQQSRRGGILLHTTSSASQELIQQEQFEFRADNGGGGPPGTVTYRVVQVAQTGAGGSNSNDEMDSIPQIMSTSNNYSSQAGSSNSGTVQAVLATSPLNGQFYVIGSPQEMFASGNQRNIAPRSTLSDPIGRGTSTRSGHRSSNSNANMLCLPQRRDERRRATHNEVERRRRDKINNWIMKLGKIIPECSNDQAKQGQSKGGILAKACEYIVELRTVNQRMSECMKENERLLMQVEALRQQNDDMRRDAASLRNQLAQHGITPLNASSSSSTSPQQRTRDLSS